MKEAIVHGYDDESLEVEIREGPIPQPNPHKSSSESLSQAQIPKIATRKGPVRIPAQNHTNTGDDITGTVHAIGSHVKEFKPGDRVASLHQLKAPHGSFAEYALGEEHSTFQLPEHVTFEEAATIPLAATTAAMELLCSLAIPEPWCQDAEAKAKLSGGIVVYGAASAVGAFAIKLLRTAKVHPIIAVAGKAQSFVRGLLDEGRGGVIVDYRNGDEAVVEGIRKGIKGGGKLRYAFDAVSEHGSYLSIARILEPGGRLTTVTPGHTYEGLPSSIHHIQTYVPESFSTYKDFAAAWFRLLYYGLMEGWISGHPHRVVPGGLEGVQRGLEDLRDGRASGFK